MNTSDTYQKHLSLSNRIIIEKMLDERKNFSQIAKELKKSNRTISYEIKKHRERKLGYQKESKNYICPILSKPPYVCNGCSSFKYCRKKKYIYSAENANMNYKNILSKSRQGIDMTNEQFINMNRIITEEIKKGHSFYMICKDHKDEFPVKERTLYNYVEKNYLDIINLDLPRKVRYKKRKKNDNNKSKRKDNKYRENRTYRDFLNYIDKHDDFIVEMDTVEGKKGESVLLTLLWRHSNFILAIKLDNKDSDNVKLAFNKLKMTFGNEHFHRYFPIVLTDNGVEFSDPFCIEYNGMDVYESKVFYCDPKQSQQKGKIEVTHEYIRRFIPKGTSFDNYSQDDINLMINQINNTPREFLEKQDNGYNTPFDMQQELFDSDILNYFNIHHINSKDVILNDSIFKKKDN